jgi:glycosyltransferase involved in cell wall biosynthesis
VRVKVVLAVDAIIPPLTGIGRYTWELANYYSGLTDKLDDVRFYMAGRWIQDPAQLLEVPIKPSHSRVPKFLRPSAKKFSRWNGQRATRKHLFHSPNYFLPKTVSSGIVTVHDLSVFKYPEMHPAARLQHFEQSFESTLNRSVHLITDSEAIRHEVSEYFGWSLDKITSVSLGVSPEFRPYNASELVRQLSQHDLIPGRYSLCVSTLEPRKRVDRLLQAYTELPTALRQRYPLVLAGSSGWLNDELRQQITRGEEEGWLRYVGFVSEEFLPLLYAGARAFFFPSLYEGFGLPVLEALAAGVPTLTSNCSSLPEVADGAAWLVEPDDNMSLLEGVEKVLSDDVWRALAIERGLAVASGASWQRCAERTLDVYQRFV